MPGTETSIDYGFLNSGNHAKYGADGSPSLTALFSQMPDRIACEIAARDTMYDAREERVWPHYALVGHSALQCIRLAMLACGKDDFRRILDLPCGHGRVLRVLRAAFPSARITACDADMDGVDFCACTFGAIPVYAVDDPEEIPIKERFDLIYSGSLFTHLNQRQWWESLQFFNSVLAPGGILVFSTHGRESVRWLRTGKFDYGLGSVTAILKEYDANGFGFQRYTVGHLAKQQGIAISSPAWVVQQLARLPELRLINFTEKGLDNHQDVVACIRE
jgi:SAM-dependent methyltransferase